MTMTSPGEQHEPAPNLSAQSTVPSSKTSGSRVSVGQVLGAILLVLVVVFVVENTTEVRIRIIAGPKVQVPIYVAILISAVVGALIAALLRYRRHRKTKVKTR